MTDVTFKVPDMDCAHCKAAVEGELIKLPGVESSNANVETGIVEVRYDESRVNGEQLVKAVEEAGYTPK